MEVLHFLVNLPLLFFQALNGGKDNACLAIVSLMILFILPLFLGILLSRKKFVHFAVFWQAILLAVIFMIYSQWVIVVLIAAGIACYSHKFSGEPA